MIGKLQRIPLREVWKDEALDFTKWLEDNPDVLSDGLGVVLFNELPSLLGSERELE